MEDLKNERIQLRALETLFAQKRFSDAFTFAEKLTSDYPNSYHIGFIYVKILKELNRLQEAEAAALKLIPLSPDNINLLSELGIIYLKLNKYDESYDYFNKVLFLDPFNNEARESMDKIKDLKKINSGDQDSSPDIVSQRVNFEAVEPGKEPDEGDEGIEFAEPIEPTEPVEAVESIETGEFIEPVEPPSIIPMTPMTPITFMTPETPEIPETPETPMEKFENMQDMQDMQDMQEVQDVQAMSEMSEMLEMSEMSEMTGIVKAAEIAEIEGITEMPGVVDVAEEMDFMGTGTQPVDPYADFYNEEIVESEEENGPVKEVVPETAQVIAMDEAGDASEFVTESAAILYLSQGLYDDALNIYEKLYATSKEGRYLLKVKQLKAHRIGLEKIRRLNEFLRLIQMKGA